MKKIIVVPFILFWSQISFGVEEGNRVFADQEQYEIFYEFTYRSNVVESFILECTGDRGVSYKLGFAAAEINNSYKSEILGMDGIIPDPFTNKHFLNLVWDEIKFAVTRNQNIGGDVVEPVLMAQKDTARLFDDFKEDKDVLCDFLFWEEVLHLEKITDSLISDTKKRYHGTKQLDQFEFDIQDGLKILNRLFDNNPLKQEEFESFFDAIKSKFFYFYNMIKSKLFD